MRMWNFGRVVIEPDFGDQEFETLPEQLDPKRRRIFVYRKGQGARSAACASCWHLMVPMLVFSLHPGAQPFVSDHRPLPLLLLRPGSVAYSRQIRVCV